MIRDAIERIELETFEKQNQIIRLQSKAIDGLFRVLCQYVNFENGECRDVVEMINEAAMVRKELGY